MTQALCLNCGEIKHGAWKPCFECGFEPKTEEEFTKHLLMTDHYYSVDNLLEIGRQIKKGEVVDFDEAVLKELWVTEEDIRNLDKGVGRFLLGVGLLLLAIFALILYMLF